MSGSEKCLRGFWCSGWCHEAQLPKYAHVGEYGDLAADLYAAEAVTLSAAGTVGSTQMVRTGVAMELPSTHGALVEDRSGHGGEGDYDTCRGD